MAATALRRGAGGRFQATDETEADPSEREELLTTEFHPTLGRIERWRLADGSVQRVEEHPSE